MLRMTENLCLYCVCVHRFFGGYTELTVGFKHNYEAVPEGGMFNVCVEVPPGKLGKDLTLQLSTHSGTASGAHCE